MDVFVLVLLTHAFLVTGRSTVDKHETAKNDPLLGIWPKVLQTCTGRFAAEAAKGISGHQGLWDMPISNIFCTLGSSVICKSQPPSPFVNRGEQPMHR